MEVLTYVGLTSLIVAIIVSDIGQMMSKLYGKFPSAVVYAARPVSRTMHLDGFLWPDSASLPNGTSFDFIIAGGGVSGSVLANRLTESGNHTVLLIEAGGDPEFPANAPSSFPYVLGSDGDWAFTTEETNDSAAYRSTGGIYYPAGKMLGGSGALFIHIHSRADPACYDNWAAALNDSSWSYNSTLPYFIKSESVLDDEIMLSEYASYHGSDGPIGLSRFIYNETMNYLDAFSELGNRILLDKNGRDSVGYYQPLFEIVNQVQQHPARAYLLPVKDRQNLFVLKNTLATKILFNETKAAIGIEVLDSNDKTWVFNADKEVIVSTGVLKTPQLLMLSGVGPKEHLKSFGIDVVADLPVGQEYQDLFGVMIAHKMHTVNSTSIISTPFALSPVFVGFPALDKNQTSHPDYLTENYILTAGSSTGAAYCSLFFGFNTEVCQPFTDTQANNDLLMTFVIKLDPKSSGKILLQSRDPTDDPLIYGGFLSDKDDRADLVKYLQDYTAIVNTTFFQYAEAQLIRPNVTECADHDLYSTDYWNCYIRRMTISIFKYMSSCPMGKVVNTDLKVKDVHNLRVVDASVFPNATRAQPIATVIMVAEKAAHMILKDHS